MIEKAGEKSENVMKKRQIVDIKEKIAELECKINEN